MTASLLGGRRGLGIAWGEERIRAALVDAGFTSVDVHVLEGDPFNAHYLAGVD